MTTFEIYADTGGEYRWRRIAGGDIVADSGEGYSSKSGARRAIENVQSDAWNADIRDAVDLSRSVAPSGAVLTENRSNPEHG